MDKDLFIYVKPGHNKPATNPLSPALTGPSNTTRPPHDTPMQTSAPANVRQNESNEPQRPPSHRTRVTIGGPDRRMESKKTSTHGDELPPQPAPILEGNKASHPTREVDSTSGGSVAAAKLPTRSIYPPTSWKSTSSVESSMLSPSEQSSAVSTGELPRNGSRRQFVIGSTDPSRSAPVAPSRTERIKPSHDASQTTTKKAQLPDPETVYAHTFYYTRCPHTSPPKSRPLNVQPTWVQYREGLLTHPPSELERQRNKLVNIPPNIHILEGSCFDCDLLARRRVESEILNIYTDKLDNLMIQLSLLQRDIVAEHPEGLPNQGSESFTAFSLPSTLELTPEATRGILEIEEQLNDLIKKRDHEIKQVFKGLSARWGPGVQINRDENVQAGTQAKGRSTATTTSSTTTFGVPSPDTTPEKSVTKTSMASTGANKTPAPSRQSSNATRTRVSSTQERYSDGTHDVKVDSSVDDVKSTGRMLVDWIRPARRQSKPNEGDYSHRETHSQRRRSERRNA